MRGIRTPRRARILVRGSLLAGVLAAVSFARPVAAQDTTVVADSVAVADSVPTTDTLSRRVLLASPPLPADHWAVQAAARAEALGLAARYQPAQGSVPRMAVAAALREAAERAPMENPALAALTRAWYERFVEEFPEARDPSWAPRLLGSSAGAGFRGRSGFAAAGRGLDVDVRRTGATLRPDLREGFASASLAARLLPGVQLFAVPEARTDGVRLVRADLIAGWGPVELSLGRGQVAYGSAVGGGVVFSGMGILDRVELQTTRPLALPSVLRYLGPATFQTFATRLREPRHPGDPYLWGARGTVRPHPRITVGIQRGSMFGGDSADAPTTVGNLLRMLYGGIGGYGFENQVVSVDFRVRAPTEEVVPVTLYLEWGADDASGAWHREPAIITGFAVPAVPGLPQLALGFEGTFFPHRSFKNPPWYRHGTFYGDWASGDLPLGHPMGGEGSQFLVFARSELADARVRLDGRLFTRHRGQDGLYVPGRKGRSSGVDLRGAWRVAPRSELQLSAYHEAGSGWTEQHLVAGASVLF